MQKTRHQKSHAAVPLTLLGPASFLTPHLSAKCSLGPPRKDDKTVSDRSMQGFNLLGGWKGNKFIIENLLQECYIHYLKRKKHFNFYHSAPARMKPCNTARGGSRVQKTQRKSYNHTH